MPFSGMLRRVALVRTGVSEKRIASIITVTRIGELGTTLAVTSNRSTLRRNTTFLRNVGPYNSQMALSSQKTAFFSTLVHYPKRVTVHSCPSTAEGNKGNNCPTAPRRTPQSHGDHAFPHPPVQVHWLYRHEWNSCNVWSGSSNMATPQCLPL
jgi:hypothetical protein